MVVRFRSKFRVGYKLLRRMEYKLNQFGRVLLLQLRNLLMYNSPISFEIEDALFFMIPKGGIVLNAWSHTCFNRNRIEFIFQLLQSRIIFLDIGANVGLYTVAIAKKNPTIQVHAFEPSKWTFDVLQQNIKLNDLRNVKSYRTALGNYVGEATLQVNAPYLDALNTIGQPTHPNSSIIRQEKVPITTLDKFLIEHNIQKVDILNVDIQGAELLFFKGAKKSLLREDAPIILYKTHSWYTKGFNYHPVEIIWFLKVHGYELFIFNRKNSKKLLGNPIGEYDTTMIAVKPLHPLFNKLAGNIT